MHTKNERRIELGLPPLRHGTTYMSKGNCAWLIEWTAPEDSDNFEETYITLLDNNEHELRLPSDVWQTMLHESYYGDLMAAVDVTRTQP